MTGVAGVTSWEIKSAKELTFVCCALIAILPELVAARKAISR